MQFTKTILLAGIVVLGYSPAHSESDDWAKVHTLTVRGIDELYNLEMEKADKTFDEVIAMAPNDPRGYFFKGMIYFWTYNLNKDRQAYDKFMELSDRVIVICERLVDQNPHNALAKFYLGGTYGYRGLAFQRNGSLLKAAWDGRKGYSYLKEAVSLDSTLYDAQMGFGLFSYLVAKVPRSFRWILNVLGFSGDLEGGLNSLRLAAERGLYTKSEASFFLAQFLFVEERFDEAYSYMNGLLKKHPENTLFLVLHAQWEFRQERLESAMESARKAIAINERKKVKLGDEFAYNILGSAHFALNEYEQAKKNFESYLDRVENKSQVFNNTYYRLGLCYEMLGQRERAVWAYRQMQNSDNQWNAHFYRRGQQRLKRPLDEIDRLLIRAENASSLRRYKEANELYERATRFQNIDSERLALALYGLIQVSYEQERFDDLQRYAQQLFALKVQEELWVVPHTHFRLGQAYAKRGLVAEARRQFEAIDRYDKYDYQMRLESRVESELAKLGGVN
ncbi:MAG TPA: tetratricopeptide repeat protein [Bacteroidota bacterium]|nr:tetratricopeptide repeat protein [Bacteroidota bacterium]